MVKVDELDVSISTWKNIKNIRQRGGKVPNDYIQHAVNLKTQRTLPYFYTYI